MDLFSFDPNHAAIAREDARKNLDERAFARAILAHQRMNLAGAHREIDALQGFHTRKAFGQVADFEEGGRVGGAVWLALIVSHGHRARPPCSCVRWRFGRLPTRSRRYCPEVQEKPALHSVFAVGQFGGGLSLLKDTFLNSGPFWQTFLRHNCLYRIKELRTD